MKTFKYYLYPRLAFFCSYHYTVKNAVFIALSPSNCQKHIVLFWPCFENQLQFEHCFLKCKQKRLDIYQAAKQVNMSGYCSRI